MARRSEDIDHWVGERIGQMRRDRGLSQGALASALGLSFQQVQKYEAGLNRVSAGAPVSTVATVRMSGVRLFPS